MKNPIVMLLAAMLIAGCATPYTNDGLTGGASETQLSTSQWQVRFRGNGYTTPDKAADYCLLRCADIALREGFPFFVLIGENTRVDERRWTQPEAYRAELHRTGPDTYKGTVTGGPVQWRASFPTANNRILLLKTNPENAPEVYDAAIVARSLRQKYGIK